MAAHQAAQFTLPNFNIARQLKPRLERNALIVKQPNIYKDHLVPTTVQNNALPGQEQTTFLDEGRILAADSFATLLQANALDTFEKIRALPMQDVFRAFPGRITNRIELKSADGPRVFFLKRYERNYLSRWRSLLRVLRWPGAKDEAMREWRKIFQLRQSGFLTATPVAVGQLVRDGIVTESFLITEEIADGIPADKYFSKNLRDAPVQRKRRWLAEIGNLARRFQLARFIHKDFYLSHIFVVERGEGWKFHLIDLQRVHGPSLHLRRWYVKDLVALGFSARAKARCSRANLLRIYKAFAGVKKLSQTDKRMISKLWTQVGRLEQRRPKYKRIWNQS